MLAYWEFQPFCFHFSNVKGFYAISNVRCSSACSVLNDYNNIQTKKQVLFRSNESFNVDNCFLFFSVKKKWQMSGNHYKACCPKSRINNWQRLIGGAVIVSEFLSSSRSNYFKYANTILAPPRRISTRWIFRWSSRKSVVASGFAWRSYLIICDVFETFRQAFRIIF